MFGRRRYERMYQQGREDEFRRQRDDALREAGHRVGDDTEPAELLPKEREAYHAGRRSVR